MGLHRRWESWDLARNARFNRQLRRRKTMAISLRDYLLKSYAPTSAESLLAELYPNAPRQIWGGGETGEQWWETTYTPDQKRAAHVEAARRDYESLDPAARQLFNWTGDAAVSNMSPVNYAVGGDILRNSSGQAVKRVTLPGGESAWLTQQAASMAGVPWEGESTQYQSGETGLDRFMMNTVPLATGAIMTGGALGMLPGTGAAAGAAPFAEMAAAESALASGAGSAAAGGTAAGSLMPAAIPPVDPTFGGALLQTAPGVYAAPGATGYIGASGLGGPVYGADIPSATVSGGGAKMPPATPPGTSSIFGDILNKGKELAPYASLLGAVGGGLLGASSGTGEAGKITVEEGIPDWLMPYVKPTLDKYSTEVQNYQTDPYGVMPAAMQEFKNTVSGMYLDPSTNKWLEEYYKLGAERIKGTLSPSFGHMQAFGSHSGYNEALSRGLGDFATGLYGGNYAKERDRQTQMTAAAPNFLTQSSTSAFAPYQQYLSTVGSLGKKKDQPYFEPSAFQNMLGGAMAGYGLGSIFK
jgi:hypothetical protein